MAVGIEGIVLDPLLSQSPWPTEVGQGVSSPIPYPSGVTWAFHLHGVYPMGVWTRPSFAGMHICASSQLASAVQGFPAVLLCWPLQCKGSQRLEVCLFPARPSPSCWCAPSQPRICREALDVVLLVAVIFRLIHQPFSASYPSDASTYRGPGASRLPVSYAPPPSL